MATQNLDPNRIQPPEPLENRIFPEFFEKRVTKDPDKPVLGFVDEEPLTHGQLQNDVQALTTALLQRGVQKGDRVAILSENGPLWGVCYMATVYSSAVAIPILPDFHRAEVHHILKNSQTKIVFISSNMAHKLLETEFRDLEYVVIIDDEDVSIKDVSVEPLSDLLENIKPEKKPKDKPLAKPAEVSEDDLMEILYTSGTTGHSKGVMLTHRNIISNVFSALNSFSCHEEDRLMSILPLAHSYECTCGLLAPFYNGAQIFYIKGLPTAQTLLPALPKVKPTIILSVPLIMDKIYKKKVLSEVNAKAYSRALFKAKATRKIVHRVAGKKLLEAFGGKLKTMIFGGAAMPPEVEEFLLEGNFPFVTGYGLSESAPLLTVNPLGKQKLGSAGVEVLGVQLKIVDPDPQTGIGEIIATGENIMRGYYKNEEATKETFTEDGWLVTGDRGYMDEEGYLFIKGRSKNLIVGPSGENIFPEQIEHHLSQNSYVLESLVYEKDRRIIARVFLDYDAIDREYKTSQMDESEASKIVQDILENLRKETNAKMASYSRIHQVIEQQEEFIKTPTKKIKRYLYTN